MKNKLDQKIKDIEADFYKSAYNSLKKQLEYVIEKYNNLIARFKEYCELVKKEREDIIKQLKDAGIKVRFK